MLLPVCMSAILFSFNIGLSLFAIFVFINKFLVLAGNESNSYSNIFRGMKIFGGVQAFQMVGVAFAWKICSYVPGAGRNGRVFAFCFFGIGNTATGLIGRASGYG